MSPRIKKSKYYQYQPTKKQLDDASFCIKKGITVGVMAVKNLIDVYKIEIKSGSKKEVSPTSYAGKEAWDKVFEIYEHYRNKLSR